MSQKSDLNVKRATRSTLVATVPSPVENMAASTIATPTTKEPQQVTEGKQSLEAYLKENFDKIQQQLDMIKLTSDETKVEILKSLDFNHAETRDLKEKIVAQDRTITDLQQQMTEVLHTANKQARRITELEASNVHTETYMRRCNLIFEGCKEQEQENIYAVIVNIITNVLKLQMDPGLEIDKVHRYGRSFAGKPRPVIVKFLKHSTRDKVLLAARQLKHYDKNIYINEDLPSVVKNRRAELRSIVFHARSTGTDAIQKGDHITIAGKQYDHNSLDALPQELSLEAARTVKIGPNTIGFYSRFSPLSNFHSCSFVYDNTTYSSSEQAYQAQKALSSGRNDISRKIMTVDDCYTIKKVGDALKLPQGSKWYTIRDNIMKDILVAKFSQNESLLSKLHATGNCDLLEATRDPYWGAGVNLTDPKLKDNTWARLHQRS